MVWLQRTVLVGVGDGGDAGTSTHTETERVGVGVDVGGASPGANLSSKVERKLKSMGEVGDV